MAQSMLDKFDKYRSKYSVILALAIIIDPQMKVEVIEFTFAKIDPINSQNKIENIRSKLYYVFNEYKNVGSFSYSAPIVGATSSSNANKVFITKPVVAWNSNEVDDHEVFYVSLEFLNS
ncbi:hypothetical protein QN277_026946 [Acacia crassicarpa]|uniref:hAT-like transposase RNase-H fold domain-containing protein n=1 Tax=Acacia crassicarpa TaxID=499986 RepID=A0AAE1JD82_9FABA|nr:hypothetical protein QN277_026946 [Acacia crassicarpa]